MKILAVGNSSVAGYKWFYLSDDQNNIYIALESDSYSSNDDRAWEITKFSPSNELGAGPKVNNNLNVEIINLCKNFIADKTTLNIEWDKKNVLELYWKIKNTL